MFIIKCCTFLFSSAFTVTQQHLDSTIIKNDSTSVSSVAAKDRNRKHSSNEIIYIKDLSQCKTKQQNEQFIEFESDTNNTNDSLEINTIDPKDCNFASPSKGTNNRNNNSSEYNAASTDLIEYNSNTIRRKPKQKAGITAKSFNTTDIHAESKALLQSSLSFAKQQTFEEEIIQQQQNPGCFDINQPNLIATFHQQASHRKESRLNVKVSFNGLQINLDTFLLFEAIYICFASKYNCL